MKKFWALIIKPDTRCVHTLQDPIHISMATLDIPDLPIDKQNKLVKVKLHWNCDYLVCTLHPESKPQERLDLYFQKGVKLNFSANACIHLTGYTVSQEDDVNNKPELLETRILEGGVEIQDLKLGDGATVKFGDYVSIDYVGKLIDETQFESDQIDFCLGSNIVIRGWTIGITGMKRGGKRRITVPSALAYGATGNPPAIPPNSDIVYEIDLAFIS